MSINITVTSNTGRATIEFSEGANLCELLSQLNLPTGNARVNGAPAGDTTVLQDGDQVLALQTKNTTGN